MDPNRRFLEVAVRAGVVTADVAQSLLARASAAGRSVWDLLPPEQVERVRRAVAAEGPPRTAATISDRQNAQATAQVATAAEARSEGGRVVVRFETIDELGRGGMGRVLRARDRTVGREVAKKVLLDPASSPPHVLQRFLNEGRVTGQLEHPNIVPLYDVGTEATGEPYLVMKLVRGRSLADVLQATTEDPAHADGQLVPLLRQFVKVCEAVGYAHSRGVIHRDLKPANVMVGDFGEVLVMDWGLARLVGQPDAVAETAPTAIADVSTGTTQEGALLGTPTYMSPEQAAGLRDGIDHRADVYALGAILFELLALRPPFVAESLLSLVKQLAFEPPPAPGEVAPPGRPVPRELGAVALRALAKAPADRYASAADLAADVTRWLEGLPVTALRAGPVRRALKWAARHVELTASIVVAFLVIVLVSAGAGWELLRRDRERLRDRERHEAERAVVLERAREEAEGRARAEGQARATAQGQVEAARRRAEAMLPYLRVAELIDRNLSPEDVRGHVVPELERACALDPTLLEAHVALGRARFRGRDLAGAVRALERADALAREAGAGGSPKALLELAWIAEDASAPSLGLAPPAEYYARCRAADPADPHARLAGVLLEEDPERALEQAAAVLADAPFLPEVYTVYTNLLQRSPGSRLPARSTLERAEQLLSRGIALASPSLEVQGQRLWAYAGRAGARYRLSFLDPAYLELALQDYLKAIEAIDILPPAEAAELLTRAGSVMLLRGDEAGLKLLERATRTAPAAPVSWLALGHHLLVRGRPADALGPLEEAVRHAPAGSDTEQTALLAHVTAAAETRALEHAAETIPRLRRVIEAGVDLHPFAPFAAWIPRTTRALAAVYRAGPDARWLDGQLRALIEVGPDHAEELLRRGNADLAAQEAEAVLDALRALGNRAPAVEVPLLVLLADLRARAGATADVDAALALLEQAAELGLDPQTLRGRPALAPLADHPRVKAALARPARLTPAPR